MVLHPTGGTSVEFQASVHEPAFTAALRHINAAIAGQEQPRLLAVDTSLATARALHDLASA
jgi:hypothetical protein